MKKLIARGPNWIDSGVDLRRGDRVQVRAAGIIHAGRTRITPEGLRSTDPNTPLPRAAIGSQQTFTAPADGRLFLLVNDDNYSDNSGSFSVRLIYPDVLVR
jgi:hypothetical protein